MEKTPLINDEIKKEIIKCIHSTFSKENLLIHSIHLTGSRGKNLHSANSDYDLRVIYQSRPKDYILQKNTQTKKIKFTSLGQEIEGQAIDLLKAYNYSLDSNPFILEIIRAPIIWKSQANVIEELKNINTLCYNELSLISSLFGLLNSYINKHYHGNKKDKSEGSHKKEKIERSYKAKFLAEIVYLIVRLQVVIDRKDSIDLYRVDDFILLSDINIRPTIIEILDIRRKDKDRMIDLSDQLYDFISDRFFSFKEFLNSYSLDSKDIETRKSKAREKYDVKIFEILSGRAQSL